MNTFKSILISLFLLSSFVNSQILFSEYAEGSSYNKYLEIYNYSSQVINLDNYAFPSCSNGCDIDQEWDYMNYFPEGAIINPGDVYVITHPFVIDSNPDNEYYTAEIATYSNHEFSYLSNGDDVFAIIEVESGVVIDIIGELGPDPGTGWDVAGVENATKDHTLVRKSSVLSANSGDWVNSAGTNVNDSEWIVLDNEIWINLGSHVYDADSAIWGCTDPIADNFNPDATIDDGSCEYVEVYISGCYWCELAANYFDFNAPNTGNNMTIAISDFSELVSGDVIGVFYVDDEGFLGCGGSVDFEGNQTAIAAWGDDSSTFLVDGFSNGDTFIFLVFRDGVVYETNTTLSNTPPFTNTYGNNNFAQISNLSIEGEFIEECILPLGVDEDCSDDFYEISENQNVKKQVLLYTDLFGRIINKKSNAKFSICVYDDGTVEKKYFLNQ